MFFQRLWSLVLQRARRPVDAEALSSHLDDCERRLARAPEQPRRLNVPGEDLRALHGRDPPSFVRRRPR